MAFKKAEINVELVDHFGNDLSVVNAARVSFAKTSSFVTDEISGEKTLSSKDAKLIKYLAKHNHWTTFGHCSATFRIKAPIFVARQLVKHQVGLVWNEESRRYIDDEPEFYMPNKWRGRAENVKQGSAGEVFLDSNNFSSPDESVNLALKVYNDLLKQGVAPEQARMFLPLNTMTNWVWTGSLAAWSRVCKLRLDPHAQLEVQYPVKSISSECSKIWPVSWSALQDNKT